MNLAIDRRSVSEDSPTQLTDRDRRWWESRTAATFAILLTALPLLMPAIPPLTDLPGHIGRFRIMAEAGSLPLAQHYAVHWALVGNLGVDGIVLALAPVMGLEPATKLVVLTIPMLTVAAMLWLAREVHGRPPPTAAFAFPLAYAFPFQSGFVNFSLASALALAGLALWIRLAHRARPWTRLVLFVPISALVWVSHSFGWAMLGLFVFGAEWALRRRAGLNPWRAGSHAALMCVPMALPVLLTVAAGENRLTGATGDWFDWPLKLFWAMSLLRERWQLYDILGAGLLYLLLALALRSRALSFSPVLAAPALLGGVAFILLPAFYAGASCVDMRVLPATVAVAVLAIRIGPRADRLAGRLALAAAAFFLVRTATSTIALDLFAQRQEEALRAVPLFPEGAAVLVLVDEPAADNWNNPRLSHIAGIAIARRRVFTNEQWSLAGQQLVRPLHPAAAPYDRDPSQLVYPPTVPGSPGLGRAIRDFDRGTFGYVWTIGFPVGRVQAADLAPVWSDGRSAVYRVVSSGHR